ncbi:MAG: 7-carboxy-7-deazaguanine synthase QueE [Bacteroidia bacterium]
MRYWWVESFWTVQGEGYWAGTPAYFIRLGGCQVGCPWCDSRHTWEAHLFPQKTLDELLSPLESLSVRHVVLTGGEPTQQDLVPLVRALHQKGYFIQVETSGVRPLAAQVDWITFSPKRFQPPQEMYFEKAHELKIVIHDASDLVWAEKLRQKWDSRKPAFLQPQWYQPTSLQLILEHLRGHPHWRLSLQTHRFIDMP